MLLIVWGDAKDEIANARMTWFYNSKAKEKPLKEDNLVLRKMEAINSR